MLIGQRIACWMFACLSVAPMVMGQEASPSRESSSRRSLRDESETKPGEPKRLPSKLASGTS
ncbi:MAG: hypothetical protein ACK6A7_14785 [Planctomycetota bacterium]